MISRRELTLLLLTGACHRALRADAGKSPKPWEPADEQFRGCEGG